MLTAIDSVVTWLRFNENVTKDSLELLIRVNCHKPQ